MTGVAGSLVASIIAGVVALGMLVAELAGVPWFSLELTPSCRVPLWLLVAVYAALQHLSWRARRRQVELSDEEVTRWGDALERVTPTILSMYGDQVPVREIASSLEASHGIPPGVTLRYIIALARHVREHPPSARPPA